MFDGDQVTALCVKNPAYLKYFMPLCPTYHYIDRADGQYARSMQFEKDYSAILSAAWSIDSAVSNYLENPDADTSELMHMLGIDEAADAEKEIKLRELLSSDLTKGAFKERMVDPFGHWVEDPA